MDMASHAVKAAAAAEMKAAAAAPTTTPEAASETPSPVTDPGVVDDSGVASADDVQASPPVPDKSAVQAAREAQSAKALAFAERQKAVSQQRAAQLAEKREREELQRANENYRRQQALVTSDPLAYLEQHGLTAEQLVERGLRQGTPEAKLAAQLEAIRAEHAALKNSIEQERQAHLARQVASNEAGYRAAFHAAIKADSESFSHIGTWPEHVLERAAYETASAYWQETGGANGGEIPDPKLVLLLLEEDARKAYKARSGVAAAMKPKQDAPRTGEPPVAKQPTGHSTPRYQRASGSTRRTRNAEAVAELSRLARTTK
jgi:hypothetical protein